MIDVGETADKMVTLVGSQDVKFDRDMDDTVVICLLFIHNMFRVGRAYVPTIARYFGESMGEYFRIDRGRRRSSWFLRLLWLRNVSPMCR